MNPVHLVPKPVRQACKQLLRRAGYAIVPVSDPNALPQDVDDRFLERARGIRDIIGAAEIAEHTTYLAVEYVVKAGIAGDLIECGVYRGRQIVVMGDTLNSYGVSDRDIYLYDTFSGQTKPTIEDYKDTQNPDASYRANLARWEKGQVTGASRAFKVATVDEVRGNVYRSGYPKERFHFVEGDVLRTLPNDRHDRIALLRLHTDGYASTKHELECLYDKLVVGGVLIIPPYGRWRGCRKATDEFFASLGRLTPFLIRTGGSERVSIKVR